MVHISFFSVQSANEWLVPPSLLQLRTTYWQCSLRWS